MSNLYDLPKDVLIKIITEIQMKERIKFYQRWSLQELKWGNIDKIIESMIEDSKDSNSPSDFLKFVMCFHLDVFQHFMSLEQQNTYLLPNVKNTSVKSWSEIYRYFDSKKFTYCKKCNSLYLGLDYVCNCQN